MNLPSFPTDSLYKFLFISGLILFVYSETILQSSIDKYEDNWYQHKKEFTNLKSGMEGLLARIKKVTADEDNIINLQKTLIAKLKKGDKDENLFKDISDAKKDLLIKNEQNQQLQFEVNKEQEEFNLTSEHLSEELRKIKALESKSSSFKIASYILLSLGFLGWYRTQRHQDQILKSQYLETIKHDKKCQSCGTILRFDTHKVSENYCSHCHNGTDYTNPDLSLKELKNEIKTRMMKQGFSRLDIWFHLNTLDNLDRWKTNFRW